MAINKNNIIKAAQKFIEKGQLDKAIKEYRKIVQADPKDIRVRLKIGDLLVNKGALKDAAATYRQVAEAYMEQGFQTRAIAVFKQVLKLAPQDVEVHKKLAELFRQKELINDALIQLEVLYKTLMKMERQEEAREVVQEMVSLDDENVALRIRLAESFSRENKRKEAVEQFTVAARLLRSGERPQDYIKVAERLLWHDPENVEVSKELARRYLAMNEPRRALQKLQAAFKADSQGVETLNLLAESFQGLKQGDKAATILKELAKVLSMRGDREGARKTYRKALGLAPNDKEAQKALRELEGRAAAESVSSRPVAAASPGQVSRQVPETGGEIDYEDLEEIDEIEEIEEIEEIDPDAIVETEDLSNESEEVENILQDVDAFVKYNLYDKAIEHIQGFLATYPNNLVARIRYAELLADAGRIPEAVSEYRVVSGAIQEEEPETAISLLDRALQLVPDNEEVAAELGALTGRSTEDIMAAVAGADGPEGDDFSELSGLRILEDIEAEAETMQPTFATQEISVSKVEGLSHLRRRSLGDGFKDANTVDDSIEDLDGLGLLEDEDWGGEDVVDLEGIGEISFGPAEPTMESKADAEPFGGDDREEFIATTQGGMEAFSANDDDDDGIDEIHLPDDDDWGLEDESRGAEEGLKVESEKVDPATVGDGFPLSEEMGRELADLENELDLLSPSVLPKASEAPDTAVVDVDSLDEPESEAPLEDELVLRPPEDEPVLDGAGAMPGSEDYLLDELDQLEEAQQLIAELKEATGEQAPVGGSGTIKETSQAADDEVEVDFGDLEVDDSQEPAATHSAEEPEDEQGREESEAPKPEMVGDLQGLADSWEEPEEARESDVLEKNTLSGEGAADSKGGEPAFTQERLEALRDEMEEAEFFISQELYQDALDMFNDLKEQFGEHPELMAKIRDISSKIDSSDAGEEDVADSEGQSESVSLKGASVVEPAGDVAKKDREAELVEAKESPEGDEMVSEERLEEVEEVLDSAVDALAEMELMDLDESSAEEPTQVQSGEPEGAASTELVGRDAEVFKKFRDGVATQVEEDDSDTHFDLGIAYKEMGMVEDAVKEFQKAMKSPEKEVQAHMLLAVCYLDVGKLSNAVNEYKQALHSQNITPEEQLDAYYQLGTVYEQMGDLAESVYYLEKVKKRLPSYRDVGDRLAGLYEKLET